MKNNWGKLLINRDYLKIEYEDLISNPTDTLNRCLDYLSLDKSNVDKIVDSVSKFKTERPENKEWQQRLRTILKKMI